MNRLVHPSLVNDERTRLAHERFLAFNLFTGLAALALLPLYLASHIPPATPPVNLFMIYSLNLFLALAVSRTGKVRPAAHLHAVAMSWGLMALCLSTGGMSSFALPLLLIVPLTGALLGDRHVLTWQIGAAGTSILLLFIADGAGLAINKGFEASILGLGADGFAMAAALAQIVLFALLPGDPALAEAEAKPREEAPFSFEPLLDICILTLDRDGATMDVRGAKSLGLASGRKVTLETLRERLHLHDLPAFMKAVSDCLHAEGKEQDAFEVRLQLKDGEWTPFRVNLLPLGHGQGEAAALLSFRSLGEQQALRHELEHARKAADQVNHAKSRFLSSVSHELRTPLNAVIGFSDILSEEHFGTLDQRQVREYARIIRDSGQNLLHFVNQIIDLSKIESGSFDLIAEPFAVAPVLRAVLEEFGAEIAAKQLRVELDLAEDLGELVQDRRACARVVKQILSNAIKFSPDGGAISLSAGREWRGVRIAVRDEGPGIPLGAEGELLQPFARLNSSYSAASEGSGLGLTIAKGLVELQGGSLHFKAANHSGTTVEIRFPSLEGNLLSLEPGERVPQAGETDKPIRAVKTG